MKNYKNFQEWYSENIDEKKGSSIRNINLLWIFDEFGFDDKYFILDDEELAKLAQTANETATARNFAFAKEGK